MLRIRFLVAVIFALNAAALFAQPPERPPQGDQERDEQGPPRRDDKGSPPQRPPRGRHGRPPNPLMEALDTNHDGELSAEEIANAAASLKKLDKNGDGKLTEDELRPTRRPGGRRGGPDGDDGTDRGGPGRGGPAADGPGDGGPGGPGADRGGPGGDAGGPPGGRFGRGNGPGGAGRGPGGRPSPERMVEHAMRFDADGDGKLNRAELLKFAKDC